MKTKPEEWTQREVLYFKYKNTFRGKLAFKTGFI